MSQLSKICHTATMAGDTDQHDIRHQVYSANIYTNVSQRHIITSVNTWHYDITVIKSSLVLPKIK